MKVNHSLQKGFLTDGFAKKKLEVFSRSTGIPVRLIDYKGKEIWTSNNFLTRGRFCLSAFKTIKTNCCRISHQSSARESIRWGVPIIGVCCPTIMQITVPLMDSNRLIGSIVASPFLMTPLTDPDVNGFAFPIPARFRLRFLRAFAKIPVIREKKASAASQKLFNLANQLSQPDLSCLARVRQIQDLQGKVAEEIQEVKLSNPDFNPSQALKLTYETEREIISRICGAEKEKAKEILYRLLAMILAQYLFDLNLLKVAILELVVVISRAALEAGAKVEDILGLKYQCVSELWSLDRQEEICLWTVNVVDNIIENIYLSQKGQIDSRLKRVLQYVDQQYHGKITTDKAAQIACLSSSRFMHLFREEMGMTFLDYLTKVRIQNSRSMLKDADKAIAQVACEVGFADQSYFTKVFKKTEGTTPKSFRLSYFNPK